MSLKDNVTEGKVLLNQMNIFFKKGSRSLRNVFLLRYFTNYLALHVFLGELYFTEGMEKY